MKSGNICGKITTVEECETAAKALGLSDTIAYNTSNHGWPPHCFYKAEHKFLIFNADSTSPTTCSNIEQCICMSGMKTYSE